MSLLKERKIAPDARLKEIKEARKASDQAHRQQYKQILGDRGREVMLVGEAVLRRFDRGELDVAEFRNMMDEALSRPADRALFELD